MHLVKMVSDIIIIIITRSLEVPWAKKIIITIQKDTLLHVLLTVNARD